MNEIPFNRHLHKIPWWQFYNRCPVCKGRVWVKSQTVVAEGIKRIYTCIGCGYPKERN